MGDVSVRFSRVNGRAIEVVPPAVEDRVKRRECGEVRSAVVSGSEMLFQV